MTDDGTPMTASQLTKKERMAILRHDMLEQDPEIRAHNFDEVNLGYALDIARQEAERCLQCPKEYCIEGCPVAVNIPRFISYLRDGDVHAAAESLLGDNALPCVTGRVCPQETQCEQVCLRAKTGRPVAIGYLERFVADWAQAHNGELAHATPRATQKKVAIVGSGPAGLTAAGELARRGHAVTVYEAFHAAGGVLLYGIPEFRLPKSVVQREVDRLVAAGVTIEPNAIIGKTYTLAELRESFDAIFVAVGAGLPVFMNVPGENLKGVLSANEYLTRVNLMGAWNPDSDTPVLHGQRVVVVGGGNVAMDSVRTARRLGAAEARICYRRSRDELPARAEEVHHAEQEGVIFDLLVAPLEVLGDEAEEDAVDPLAVAEVGLSPHALAGEAGPLGVHQRALVEAVHLQLEPVEAEIVDEVPLEEPRRLVRDPAPAEVRVHGEPAQVRDPAAQVRALEAHRSRAHAVHLDQEDAERVWLLLRALYLGADLPVLLRPDRGEKRLDVLVAHELGEEPDVLRRRPANRHRHAADSWARPPRRRWPEPRATPTRMSARPPSAAALTGSSRMAAP